MRIGVDSLTPEPDIVAIVLEKITQAVPGIAADLLHQVEREVRAQYGGQRLFVPKGSRRGKSINPALRQAVYQDGLTGMENEEITAKHKIGRTTLYRIMKEGGGRFA